LKDLEEVILGGFLEIVDGDLVQSSCNVDCLDLEASLLILVVSAGAEKGGNGVRIDRRRGDDDFEVVPALEDPLEEAEEDIEVDGPLVDIVQNDGRILLKERTAVELLNEGAVGHEDHPCILIDP
jgi:hypothetical protein